MINKMLLNNNIIMTNFILILLIFCLVLFFYIHIYFHQKKSNDLEIYEIDNPSKDKLEEICDLRQPVIFNFNNDNLNQVFNINNLKEKYSIFDVKVRNINNLTDNNEEMYIPIKLIDAINVIENNTENNEEEKKEAEKEEKKYIIENSIDFLEETGLIKYYKLNDLFIRPYSVLFNEYDYITGTDNYETLLRYNINYRNYYYITEGEIKIKLIPPKYSKYLYENKDYDNFEFLSLINPWNVSDKYKEDFEKVKCLEVTITKGQIIYIPAFWWYSIKFNKNTSICNFKYTSYMNYIAMIHHHILKFLQSHNIKRNIVNNVIKIDD